MNYIEAVKRLAFVSGEGRAISVGMLMRARAVDMIKPGRLGALPGTLLFDDNIFDFWEIMQGDFDGNVSFETPRAGLFPLTIMSEDLLDSPFVTNFTLSDITPNLFGIGGYVESEWENTVTQFSQYYNKHKISLEYFGIYDTMKKLASVGVLTVLEVGNRWDDLAGEIDLMLRDETTRAAIIGEKVRVASHDEQKQIQAIADTVENFQPANIIGYLFGNLGLPLLLLAGGVGVLYATRNAASKAASEAIS